MQITQIWGICGIIFCIGSFVFKWLLLKNRSYAQTPNCIECLSQWIHYTALLTACSSIRIICEWTVDIVVQFLILINFISVLHWGSLNTKWQNRYLSNTITWNSLVRMTNPLDHVIPFFSLISFHPCILIWGSCLIFIDLSTSARKCLELTPIERHASATL